MKSRLKSRCCFKRRLGYAIEESIEEGHRWKKVAEEKGFRHAPVRMASLFSRQRKKKRNKVQSRGTKLANERKSGEWEYIREMAALTLSPTLTNQPKKEEKRGKSVRSVWFEWPKSLRSESNRSSCRCARLCNVAEDGAARPLSSSDGIHLYRAFLM